MSKPKRKPSTVSSDGSKLGDELSDTNSTAEKNANDVLQSILSPANSPTSSAAINSDPPESEELIKALQELENAASSDATVRETIAKLPSAVSEVSALDNLKSPEDAKTLMGEVRSNFDQRLSTTYLLYLCFYRPTRCNKPSIILRLIMPSAS